MKVLYSYQELGTNAQVIRFYHSLRVQVTSVYHQASNQFLVTFVLLVGEYTIGELISEYDTIEELLDAFDISAHEEIFELLAGKGKGGETDAAS